jgi:hypothetical protein
MATVTVTGIRRGIEDAISVKKDSTSIVEAISAEDIGKLPDVSPSPNRSPACQVWPPSASPAVRSRSPCAACRPTSRPRC